MKLRILNGAGDRLKVSEIIGYKGVNGFLVKLYSDLVTYCCKSVTIATMATILRS